MELGTAPSVRCVHFLRRPIAAEGAYFGRTGEAAWPAFISRAIVGCHPVPSRQLGREPDLTVRRDRIVGRPSLPLAMDAILVTPNRLRKLTSELEVAPCKPEALLRDLHTEGGGESPSGSLT